MILNNHHIEITIIHKIFYIVKERKM